MCSAVGRTGEAAGKQLLSPSIFKSKGTEERAKCQGRHDMCALQDTMADLGPGNPELLREACAKTACLLDSDATILKDWEREIGSIEGLLQILKTSSLENTCP